MHRGSAGRPRATWHSDAMRARSALFDVYGDHLRGRGHQAPVSALIRLLEPVGIAAPAVRTAISRMAAQGWLEPTRVDAAPGYRATRARSSGSPRPRRAIYRSAPEPWDGRWRLVFVALPGHRSARKRLREELHYLGYAEHAPGVWVCPFDRCRGRRGGRPGRRHGPARASRSSLEPDPVGAWDLSALATSYAAWPGLADDLLEDDDRDDDEDEAAFAARFRLVHEWRKFLFDDPGLPAELLPRGWPGVLGGRPVHQRGRAPQARVRPVRHPV